jgi:type I restriction enzyme S subunit
VRNWPTVDLTSIVDCLESGKRPKGGATANGVPSIGGEHVRADGTVDCEVKTFVPEAFFREMKKGVLKDGDILVVKDGATTGKTGAFRCQSPNYEAAANEHVFIVRANERLCLQRFVFHLLRSPSGNQMIMTDFRGAAQGGISRGFAEKVRFPLPPLDEQRRIVGLLDRAAEIRRRAGAARAKARAIIPALFLDTFGDPATNPKGWPTERLGAIAKLTGGGTPSKANAAFWGGTIPWVSPKDMKPPTIFESEDKITDAAIAASPVNLVPAGNVLIVVRGMILAHTVPIRMNAIAVTLNQDMKAIVPNECMNSVFLRWALQSLHGYFLSKVRESAHGTKKLETAVLTEYALVVPPLAPQTAFAEQVQRIEALARHLDAAAAKADAMAAGLSAEAFA